MMPDGNDIVEEIQDNPSRKHFKQGLEVVLVVLQALSVALYVVEVVILDSGGLGFSGVFEEGQVIP